MSTSLKLLKMCLWANVCWVLLEKWYMLVKKIYLPGQVKSIQYETNINSHIKHGNMLLKNWTKVLTLHIVLWNNTATYIIWTVWDNYWLSQKSVARDTVHVSFISKLFFRLNVSLLLCPGFRILCSVSLVMTTSHLLSWWVKLAYLIVAYFPMMVLKCIANEKSV